MRAAVTLERQALGCGVDEDDACAVAEPPIPLRECEPIDVDARPRSIPEISSERRNAPDPQPTPTTSESDPTPTSSANASACGSCSVHPSSILMTDRRTHTVGSSSAAEQFLRITKTTKEVDQGRRDALR